MFCREEDERPSDNAWIEQRELTSAQKHVQAKPAL